MIRTLIFGAIAGYVGKKLYDEGKLTEFKNDLTTRLNLDRDPAAPRPPAATATTTPRASVN
ncbi:hypothetical protein [Sphingobium aromaticiconvertens]|uniref:hypothetical protein n=1 Tax=Sphingobium aromaticiconvertens TaxID=365341 RepID=UPI0030186542